MENFKISLRQITEDNFMEAFHLKHANGQERSNTVNGWNVCLNPGDEVTGC